MVSGGERERPLLTAHHFFPAISPPLCVLARYSVLRGELLTRVVTRGNSRGKKYRSIVTVPSETVSEPLFSFFFFFFIRKRHASPKRGTEMGNCENLQSFAGEDWREKCSSLWRVNRYSRSDLSFFRGWQYFFVRGTRESVKWLNG